MNFTRETTSDRHARSYRIGAKVRMLTAFARKLSSFKLSRCVTPPRKKMALSSLLFKTDRARNYSHANGLGRTLCRVASQHGGSECLRKRFAETDGRDIVTIARPRDGKIALSRRASSTPITRDTSGRVTESAKCLVIRVQVPRPVRVLATRSPRENGN